MFILLILGFCSKVTHLALLIPPLSPPRGVHNRRECISRDLIFVSDEQKQVLSFSLSHTPTHTHTRAHTHTHTPTHIHTHTHTHTHTLPLTSLQQWNAFLKIS